MDAALDWILPVNINAIKNARSLNTVGEVAGNEGLHAGANEIAQMLRRSRAGKTLRLSPAAEGDEDLQIGIKMLQLLKLMKSAAQLVWTLRVSAAVHAGGSIVFMVQRHLTIRDLALVVRYVAKSIVQLRKQTRRSACHNIFYRIFAGCRAGLSEIANDLALMAFIFRVERGAKGDQCHQNQ